MPCDVHDLDTFEELAAKIGAHWVTVLNDMAMNDFLGRETEDGNVVDLYLKRRGWNEKAIPKAYLKGIRESVTSLCEVSNVRRGESFMARDLILEDDPVLVEERSATQTMLQWEHFAMRIVEVRGHHVIAGGLLPYRPDLTEEVVDEIRLLADDVETEIEKAFREQDERPEPGLIRNLSMAMVLKTSAPCSPRPGWQVPCLIPRTWNFQPCLTPRVTKSSSSGCTAPWPRARHEGGCETC